MAITTRAKATTDQRRARDRKRLSTEAHLGMTSEEWRSKKRQQWREVMDALSRFQFGAAYTPAGVDLFEITRAANRIHDALSEEWVPW